MLPLGYAGASPLTTAALPLPAVHHNTFYADLTSTSPLKFKHCPHYIPYLRSSQCYQLPCSSVPGRFLLQNLTHRYQSGHPHSLSISNQLFPLLQSCHLALSCFLILMLAVPLTSMSAGFIPRPQHTKTLDVQIQDKVFAGHHL